MRPRAGLAGSRQTCVRRRQGPGWHNDPPDFGELNGFIRGQLEINETKDRHDHQPFQHFSILRAVKNGSVSREGGSQRGNCATAAVTALVASARVWILLVHAKHLLVVANCAVIPGANVGDFPTCCLEVFPAGSKILWGWPTQQ